MSTPGPVHRMYRIRGRYLGIWLILSCCPLSAVVSVASKLPHRNTLANKVISGYPHCPPPDNTERLVGISNGCGLRCIRLFPGWGVEGNISQGYSLFCPNRRRFFWLGHNVKLEPRMFRKGWISGRGWCLTKCFWRHFSRDFPYSGDLSVGVAVWCEDRVRNKERLRVVGMRCLLSYSTSGDYLAFSEIDRYFHSAFVPLAVLYYFAIFCYGIVFVFFSI